MTSRRTMLLGAAALLAGAGASPALAEDFPSGEIRLLCAFPAGSGSDVIVRYFAEKLRPLAKRTVIVDNKPGAGGNIAMTYVAKAKPDGHTLYFHTGSSMAANMHVFKNPPVDAGTAFQTVATINRQAFMLTVASNSPFKTAQELTAYLKTKGDQASYARSATSGLVMGELYKAIVGLKAVEVNYRMAQDSLNDMASGRVDFGMHDPQFAMAAARAGQLRILAHAAGERLKVVPDIPTMAETGVPGMDLVGWFAVFAPASTPRSTVDTLNGWLNDLLRQPDTIEFLAKFGGDPWINTPDEAQRILLRDIKAWGEYVKTAKVPIQG